MAAAGNTNAQQITPFLWFDGKVEEAVNFYTSVFKNSEVVNINRLPAETPGHSGKVMMATMRLNGLEFMLLDGGPMFKFTEAISFFVKCETQEEVDDLWNKLTADGGHESQCGWLKDKFGLSWQVVPSELPQMLTGAEGASLDRMMAAIMAMKKFDLETLRRARAGQA